MDIIIRNATIITMDRKRRILKDGTVAISDGKITEVGKANELASETGELKIDGRGRLVIPGLVNPHCHIAYSLARGCADDLPFAQWLPLTLKVQDSYDEEEWYLTSLLSMVEMIKSGTTCFADTNIYEEIGQVARALQESGMRGVLGKSITDMAPEDMDKVPSLKHPYDPETLSIEAAVQDFQKWDGKLDGRLRVRFAPEKWPGCSENGYREVAETSRKMAIGKLIHHTEDREWEELVKKEFGKEPTMMLQEFGVLGPDAVLENAVSLTDDEMALIKETNTRFNYLPVANMKNCLGALDVSKLLKLGVTVTIGTCGGLINNTNDMFREMKTLALQQRMLKNQPDAIAPESVLEMASVSGAEALGLDKYVGSIEPGKKADIAIVNCNQPHFVPIFNPISALVYCANGGDVETTIVDGKAVMLDRKILTVDEQDLVQKANQTGLDFAKRIGLAKERSAQTKWPYD